MKLSTEKTNALYINDLPHCTMARNIYYVKSLHCTIAKSPVNPVDRRCLVAGLSAVQKMDTLAPLPHMRQRGDLAQNFSEIRREK
jgi:hypothetical protein